MLERVCCMCGEKPQLACENVGNLGVCVCVCVRLWTGEPGTEGEWTVCVCRGPGGGCPGGPREERDSEGKWL